MEKVDIDKLEARLAKLSPEQRRSLMSDIRRVVPPVRRNHYFPPTIAPKQEAFLAAAQDEVLYGGAAGGMKTSSILLGALQYFDVEGYAALLLRRTSEELKLPGSLIPLAKGWLGDKARWYASDKKFVSPEGGTIMLRYLDRDDDKWQYGSSAFDYIGVDEVCEFPLEDTYTFMFSRIRRREGSNVPGRMRLGANPIGPGASWVKRRFITTKDPTRLYIPARLDDNPYIDKKDYREKSLAKLRPDIRQALEDGDWDAKPPGKMFQKHLFRIVQAVPSDLTYVRFWDLAATPEDRKHKDPSWTCGVKMGYSFETEKFYIPDVRRYRETPGTVKKIVKMTAIADGREVEVHIEQEPGSSGKFVIDDYVALLPAHTVKAARVTGSKEARAYPYSSQVEAGNICLLEAEWNEAFLEEHSQFPDRRKKNDQVDASSGAYNILAVDVEEGDTYAGSMIVAGELPRPDW